MTDPMILDSREHAAAQSAMREVVREWADNPDQNHFALAHTLAAAAARAIRAVRESRACVA